MIVVYILVACAITFIATLFIFGAITSGREEEIYDQGFRDGQMAMRGGKKDNNL